jgi:hypothetical protein
MQSLFGDFNALRLSAAAGAELALGWYDGRRGEFVAATSVTRGFSLP